MSTYDDYGYHPGWDAFEQIRNRRRTEVASEMMRERATSAHPLSIRTSGHYADVGMKLLDKVVRDMFKAELEDLIQRYEEQKRKWWAAECRR